MVKNALFGGGGGDSTSGPRASEPGIRRDLGVRAPDTVSRVQTKCAGGDAMKAAIAAHLGAASVQTFSSSKGNGSAPCSLSPGVATLDPRRPTSVLEAQRAEQVRNETTRPKAKPRPKETVVAQPPQPQKPAPAPQPSGSDSDSSDSSKDSDDMKVMAVSSVEDKKKHGVEAYLKTMRNHKTLKKEKKKEKKEKKEKSKAGAEVPEDVRKVLDERKKKEEKKQKKDKKAAKAKRKREEGEKAIIAAQRNTNKIFGREGVTIGSSSESEA